MTEVLHLDLTQEELFDGKFYRIKYLPQIYALIHRLSHKYHFHWIMSSWPMRAWAKCRVCDMDLLEVFAEAIAKEEDRKIMELLTNPE